MADVTAVECIADAEGKVKAWVWKTVVPSSVCVPLRVEDYDDLTLSVHGTLDSATIACRGSNLNNTEDTSGLLVDYFAMTDANSATAVALATDNTAAVLLETATYIQPTFSGNGTAGTMSVDIVLGGK